MSALDLTAAVEAAACAAAERQNGRGAWSTLDGYARYMWREGVHRAVIDAAHAIEAAVRERVAREIEARIAREPVLMHVTDWVNGIDDAASIARGVTP